MKKNRISSTLVIVLALALVLGLCPIAALATVLPGSDATDYNYDAVLMPGCPGVYTVKPTVPASGKSTIGIPSIAKQNLENNPTTESPAIIMGAAVPYETRQRGAVSPDMFRLKPGVAKVEAPYSYFRPGIVEEANTTASTTEGTHYKLSGFDATYVILRIDVSELINDYATSSDTYYLHVKQWGNKAMLVAIGEETDLQFDAYGVRKDTNPMEYGTFAAAWTPDVNEHAALGAKTGSYSLANAAKALKSTDGADTATPYIDVVLLASGSMVAGGDKSAKDQGDVEISFYVDDQEYYEIDIADCINIAGNTYTTALSYKTASDLAINNPPTTAPTVTLEDRYLQKYFNATPAATYTLKGSDLALEVMMEGDTSCADGGATEYWSMSKALEHSYYDGVADARDVDGNIKTGAVIRLMSEVPVLEGLSLAGSSTTDLKKRTLDVNTFDIQIADNTSGQESKAGLTLSNAWLELMDSNTTTGSELAVGNNATMLIKAGGKLIIDPDCQLEVEFDAASVAPATGGQQPTQTYEIHNGVLTIEAGGEILNNGVLTIEGTEAKAIDPTVGTSTAATSKGQIVNRGTITNSGCLSINGEFFNLGTLINTGKYDDLITSNDPDKGTFTYHKGIQLGWKDDVTQNGQSASSGDTIRIMPGMLLNGYDPQLIQLTGTAKLTNSGDIVCAPGVLYNFADFRSEAGSSVYLGIAVDAVIPITPTQEAPTVVTKRMILSEPVYSYFINAYSGTQEMVPAILENAGTITTALVDVPNNGVLGDISAPAYLDVSSYDVSGTHLSALVQFDNYGRFYLSGNGKLVLPMERNFNNEMPVTILNCDSAQLDNTAHKGRKMIKNATAGAEAYLVDADVIVPYTTWTTSGPSFTATPVSVVAGAAETLSATVSAWSVDPLTTKDAPALAVSGTDYDKALPCNQVTNAGQFFTFSYSDRVILYDLGKYTYSADLESRGFITAEASFTVQAPSDPGYIPSGGGDGTSSDKDKDKEQKPEKTEPIVFTDVVETDWFYAATQFVAQRGYFLGTGEGAFSPQLPMTRGMFMTVLARMNNETIDGADWQMKAMSWAVKNGVSDGSAPERPITRQEIVTMLWRAAGAPEPTGDLSGRPDGGDVDVWAVKAAAWAVESGVMQGDQSGALHLLNGATRAEVAQFVMNYLSRQV